jgi:hypothetical protein
MQLAREFVKARLRKAMEFIDSAKKCGDHADPITYLDCALDQIQLVVESLDEAHDTQE